MKRRQEVFFSLAAMGTMGLLACGGLTRNPNVSPLPSPTPTTIICELVPGQTQRWKCPDADVSAVTATGSNPPKVGVNLEVIAYDPQIKGTDFIPNNNSGGVDIGNHHYGAIARLGQAVVVYEQ
jgi:hypothetical protein